MLSKRTDNRRKTVAAVCGVFVLLFAIGTAAYHRYSGYMTDETDIVHLIVAYGVNILAVSDNLTSNVKYKVEEFTGLPVEKVNVFVEGVRVID